MDKIKLYTYHVTWQQGYILLFPNTNGFILEDKAKEQLGRSKIIFICKKGEG